MRRLWLVLAVVLPSSASASHAYAQQSDCQASFAEGPRLAREGQLLAARAALVRCSSQACPSGMSSICTSDLRQLEMRIPTVVFRASDAAGNDLSDVRVSERDRVLVEALDGRAVDVDPGPRTFRFTRGGASSEASVLVIEGEKARAVSVVLHVPPRAAPPREPGARAAGGNVGERVTPWWVYAAGGASLVTTSLFAGFGISGLKRRSELDACLGACDQGAVDRAKSDFLTADVFLGASLLGYGITLTLFLLRPTVATPQAPRTTAFDRLGTF